MTLLMTPGPTRVPERVLRAGAQPMMHHRTAEFSRELAEMLDLIRPVFGTTSRVLPVHTTGRGGMEAVICNLFAPGDAVAVCANGKFGELWATIAASHGLVVHRVSADWTRDVNPDDVDALLSAHPEIRAVAMTYCDTSTAVANDVEAVCRVARARHALSLVDGVSAIGGMAFEFDKWGVDAAVTASQKCLMSTPGLAFVALSERALAETKRARLPRGYWDFPEILQMISKPRPMTPGTTPVTVVLHVAEALRMMHEEGLDAVYRRHDAMAARLHAGIARLGLAMQCPDLRRRATTLTAIAAPAGVASDGIRDRLEAHGVLVATGLGRYETTAFRIGHMGDIRLADIERTLTVLAGVLVPA